MKKWLVVITYFTLMVGVVWAYTFTHTGEEIDNATDAVINGLASSGAIVSDGASADFLHYGIVDSVADPGLSTNLVTEAGIRTAIGLGGGGGGVGDAANVGVGEGKVYRDKDATALYFKSLLSGSGISLLNLTDEIQISIAQGLDWTVNNLTVQGEIFNTSAAQSFVDFQTDQVDPPNTGPYSIYFKEGQLYAGENNLPKKVIYEVDSEWWDIEDFGESGAVTPPASVVDTGFIKYRAFDGLADEDLTMYWGAPQNFSGTGIKFRPVMVALASDLQINDGVAWGLSGCSQVAGSPYNCTSTSEGVSSFTFDHDNTTATDLVYGNFTEVIVDDIAQGQRNFFSLRRATDSSSDTYENDVGLVGVDVKYKIGLDTFYWGVLTSCTPFFSEVSFSWGGEYQFGPSFGCTQTGEGKNANSATASASPDYGAPVEPGEVPDIAVRQENGQVGTGHYMWYNDNGPTNINFRANQTVCLRTRVSDTTLADRVEILRVNSGDRDQDYNPGILLKYDTDTTNLHFTKLDSAVNPQYNYIAGVTPGQWITVAISWAADGTQVQINPGDATPWTDGWQLVSLIDDFGTERFPNRLYVGSGNTLKPDGTKYVDITDMAFFDDTFEANCTGLTGWKQ